MDLALTIVLGMSAVIAGGAAVLLWTLVVMELRDRTPPGPHDPQEHIRRFAEQWSGSLSDVAGRPGTGRGGRNPDARIAVLLECRGGGASDTHAVCSLTVRMPDGTTAGIADVQRSEPGRVLRGSFLPVHVGVVDGLRPVNGEVALADGLDEADPRRLLLDHRQTLGLIDPTTRAVLETGRAGTAAVVGIRPTGRFRAGHAEIEATLEAGDGVGAGTTVRGFLRSRELVAARRTGTLPATRGAKGTWVLGPTWY
ncbi:hypothetical protein ACFC34_12070 [Streptomyces sp. NPDC056053]|uniref:hypothetical protein n=1 Tax=Streptomyces sp. NPDC056053 TaxID=3345696 RepID=UPI0035E08695